MKQEPDAPRRQDCSPKPNEASSAPPRIEPPATNPLAVMLIRMLLAFALMNILAKLLHSRQGFAVAFDLVGTAAFLPFSAALAAALGRQRGLLLFILGATLLTSWPSTIVDLEHLVVPVAVGILAGTGLTRVLQEGSS